MKRSMSDFFRPPCAPGPAPEPGCGFRIIAHNTGVSVSATMAERMMEPAMVIENCR